MARIRYTLSVPEPHTHLLHVKMEIIGVPGDQIDLVLPSWVPGSYKIRDFARHVQDFDAGRRDWRKTGKARWRVSGGRRVTVTYRVWAFELSVQTSHVDAEHAFVNGGTAFLYVDGHKDAPCEVRVRPPRGWKVATGMPKRGGAYRADDYDIIVDSPIEIGTFTRHTFRERRVPHHLVIHGRHNGDEKQLVRDIRKIVRAEMAVMRHVPYKDYTFILHNAVARGGGGLEHLNSCALQVPPDRYRPRDKYELVLELVAHEFWHLWNVKRIHPEMLGPFDYEREVHTTMLWVMEGITNYYDALMLPRAEICPPDRFFRRTAERIRRYEQKPGRRRQSLAQSSFDTWIKLYQPNENALNATMSYYEKGQLVGMCLDLEIRRRTKNRRSLDDVMRTLYREYARKGVGFPEEDFRGVCERVAGAKLGRFFSDFVDGTREIPWDTYLESAGLRLVKLPVKPVEGEKRRAKKPWLGTVTRKQGRTLTIAAVLEDSPAWKAGLSPHDEIVALNDFRINPDEWDKRLGEHEPGDPVRVAVFRAGYLKEIPVTVGAQPNVTWAIRRLKTPTALQKKIYKGWLGKAWPSK